MFGITYETWKNTCQMYFDLGKRTKAAYLQWFPFTKISSDDQDTIASEDFYNRYIKSGAFVLFPAAMHRSENFIQKGDGSFRERSIVDIIRNMKKFFRLGPDRIDHRRIQIACTVYRYSGEKIEILPAVHVI